MSGIWAELGYHEAFAEMAQDLRDTAGLHLLEGPPGTGKSWLARGLGAFWKRGGASTIIAEGDHLHANSPYAPFGLSLAEIEPGWNRIVESTLEIAKAAESLAGTAGVISSTVQALVSSRSQKRSHAMRYLGDQEQTIVADLEQLGRSKAILLVADDLQWWDRGSLTFLRQLLAPRMASAFPFLSELRVLAVQTPEPYQPRIHEDALDTLLSSAVRPARQLERIDRLRFGRAVTALRPDTPIPVDTLDKIYRLTGGHLALAVRIARNDSIADIETALELATLHEFIMALLDERMQSLGALGRDARDLLQMGAFLGSPFRKEDAVCASEAGEFETLELLRVCRDEELLEARDGAFKFSHDVYREFFLTTGAAERLTYAQRFRDCLRRLRPGEYMARAENSLLADDPQDAISLAIQAHLQAMRNGTEAPAASARLASEVSNSDMAQAALQAFRGAWQMLASHQHQQALAKLDMLPKGISTYLLAEADYLRALCRLSTRNEVDREIGRSILSAWSGLRDQEAELGIRLSLLHLYGLCHLFDKREGRKLEGEIRRHLIDRVAFDPSAEDAFYILDRIAGALYLPDIALVRNSEAAKHFDVGAGRSVHRMPVEHYRCLTNLGANLITNGRFDEAVEVSTRIEDLIETYEEDTFPRVELPLTNAVLARFRAGLISVDEAREAQRAIVDAVPPSGDRFYLLNAWAAYTALSGDPSSAVETYADAIRDLTGRHAEPEPSMEYLLRANGCCARFLDGGSDAIGGEWEALGRLVRRINYVTQPSLVRRHELLKDILAMPEPPPPLEFDEVLLHTHPDELGSYWVHLCRGFRMPEIEFWREI